MLYKIFLSVLFLSSPPEEGWITLSEPIRLSAEEREASYPEDTVWPVMVMRDKDLFFWVRFPEEASRYLSQEGQVFVSTLAHQLIFTPSQNHEEISPFWVHEKAEQKGENWVLRSKLETPEGTFLFETIKPWIDEESHKKFVSSFHKES